MNPNYIKKHGQSSWPELPATADWQETLDTVHLWSQIIGKIRLEHMPWINHSWHVPLYISSRGLTTSQIPHTSGGFEIEFNFSDHCLEIRQTNGEIVSFKLQSMSVADFYLKTMESLKDLDIPTQIYPKPVEIPDPIIPFPADQTHKSYDEKAVQIFWTALTHIHRVFTLFRSSFIGKVSPVHFFWGAFDLAVTRFSGRKAPKHPGGIPNCADWVMEEAYSHELSSAGFWPGSELGEAAFYAYAYPEPDGFRTESIKPEEAYFHEQLGEYILHYKDVINTTHPDKTLLQFLESTYLAAAVNAQWDRAELEKNG